MDYTASSYRDTGRREAPRNPEKLSSVPLRKGNDDCLMETAARLPFCMQFRAFI